MNRRCNTKCEKQICIQKLGVRQLYSKGARHSSNPNSPSEAPFIANIFANCWGGAGGWHLTWCHSVWALGFCTEDVKKVLNSHLSTNLVQVLKFWYRTKWYGNGITEEWVRNVCRYGYGLILRNSWRERNGDGLISKSWCGNGTGK